MWHASAWVSSGYVHQVMHAYGLWALFAAIVMECMGIPLPGEIMLISAALYAGSTHGLSLASIVLVATTATAVGGFLGYLIGYSVGFRLLKTYGRYVGLDERRLKVGQYLFLRHGGKIVFFARFVALLRILAAMLAGANRMPWARFMVMNALGGMCWSLLFGGGAYLFGEEIKRVAGPASLLLLVMAACLLAVGIVFFRRHERELERRAEMAISDRR
jgi:membrane protein DedA with SNARE-associated domain